MNIAQNGRKIALHSVLQQQTTVYNDITTFHKTHMTFLESFCVHFDYNKKFSKKYRFGKLNETVKNDVDLKNF